MLVRSGENSDSQVSENENNSVQILNEEFSENDCSDESGEDQYNNIMQASVNDIFMASSRMHREKGYPWSPSSTKVRACNIIRRAPEIRNSKIFRTPRDAFEYFVTESESLQQKWKDIRTSFTKELKRRAGAESGLAASGKSPYVYVDQLHFLRQTVVNNTTQSSMVKIRANKNLDEGKDDVSDSSMDMVLESEGEADWPQVEEDESTLEELNCHYEVKEKKWKELQFTNNANILQEVMYMITELKKLGAQVHIEVNGKKNVAASSSLDVSWSSLGYKKRSLGREVYDARVELGYPCQLLIEEHDDEGGEGDQRGLDI
ncbi:hypothetical protein FQA39_LY11865 [Lamprigera yunnana]|nr:hypothetical protein FQA39_LY11865 [Lamprigera yunnana]